MMNIFQLLPYRDPSKYQALKLFPNPKETNSYLKSNKTTLPSNGEYRVQFPENINKTSVDEYLLFITSKEKLQFINEYTTIEDLKRAYMKTKNKVKYQFKAYSIINKK